MICARMRPNSEYLCPSIFLSSLTLSLNGTGHRFKSMASEDHHHAHDHHHHDDVHHHLHHPHDHVHEYEILLNHTLFILSRSAFCPANLFFLSIFDHLPQGSSWGFGNSTIVVGWS